MKIGIVGCTSVTDIHINCVNKYYGADIIGVVDENIAVAESFALKYGIDNYYDSLDGLLNCSKFDVIHILTSPITHFYLAKKILQSGASVFINAPLALNYEETEQLYDIANEKGVMFCPALSYEFLSCVIQCKQLIDSGHIGNIVNIECDYLIDSKNDSLRKYPTPNQLPWSYIMPAGVFHNHLYQQLYFILPYLGKYSNIHVEERSFGELPQNISDKLKIIIKGEKAVGKLMISFKPGECHNLIKIYGREKILIIDLNKMALSCHSVNDLSDASLPEISGQVNLWQSFKIILSKVINKNKHGNKRQDLKKLISQFYDAVNNNSQMPVSKKNILHVIMCMDEISPQIKNKNITFNNVITHTPDDDIKRPLVLVTGATGFLGRPLVKMLLKKGYRVRALVRKLSNIDPLKVHNVQIFYGDVACLESLESAFKDVDFVVHAAADTIGDKKGGEINTVLAVKNIIDLCVKNSIKKLIYVSSCNVYGVADYKKGTIISEKSGLEKLPDQRGPYTYSKLKAETLVKNAMKNRNLNAVCLRPGTYFGFGGDYYTPMMGMSLGFKIFIVIGNGEFILPLVYIENVADAIITSIEKDAGTGEIYNVIDENSLTKKQYVEYFLKRLYPKAHFIYVPYIVFYTVVFFQEVLVKLLNLNPFLTRYRLLSSQNDVIYDSSKIKIDLDWKAPCTLHKALDEVIKHEQNKIIKDQGY